MTGIFLFLLGLLGIGVCIFVIIKFGNLVEKNGLDIYFMSISLISFLAFTLFLGFSVNSFFQITLISHESYLTQDRWEIQQCYGDTAAQMKYTSTRADVTNNSVEKSEEEIEECILKAEKNLIDQRNYNAKLSLLENGLWGVLFLVVYLITFPVVVKRSKE